MIQQCDCNFTISFTAHLPPSHMQATCSQVACDHSRVWVFMGLWTASDYMSHQQQNKGTCYLWLHYLLSGLLVTAEDVWNTVTGVIIPFPTIPHVWQHYVYNLTIFNSLTTIYRHVHGITSLSRDIASNGRWLKPTCSYVLSHADYAIQLQWSLLTQVHNVYVFSAIATNMYIHYVTKCREARYMLYTNN